MKLIPNAISARFARQALIASKNSPALLFSAGIVGVVTSTVLACKATLKVEDILEDSAKKMLEVDEILHDVQNGAELHHKDGTKFTYTERDAQKDKTYVYIRTAVALGRAYAPAVLVGVASIACLAGAQKILSNRNAALTAAYSALDKGFREYRKRVAGEVGEEREREIYRNVQEHEEIITGKDGKQKAIASKRVGPGSIYARFFDEHNPNWQATPEFNFSFIRIQENWANQKLKAQGHLLLNDVYEALGMPRTKEGCVVGWIWNKSGDYTGDGHIDFGTHDPDNADRLLDFMTGAERGIWLDFNVDGIVYDKL